MCSDPIPSDVAAQFKQLRQEYSKKDSVEYSKPMLPPWIVIPNEPPGSMAWKMGSGEDYGLVFRTWFGSLSSNEKSDYLRKYPEPKYWIGFYKAMKQ